MTPGDEIRANTWMFEAAELLIGDVVWHVEGNERRARGQGGLSINISSATWFHHSDGHGGHGLVSLVRHLKKCEWPEAHEWVGAWLRSHDGVGACTGADEDAGDDPTPANAGYARELMGRMVPLAGTLGEDYLRSRGIWCDGLPNSVGYIPHTRIGEGSLAALLAGHGRIVGIMLTHLDATGQKSAILPARSRYASERAADAAFHLGRPSGIFEKTEIIICEGIEDALSVYMLGRPVEIIGLPGIGTMAKLEIAKGAIVTVVRDGDDPDSAADKALTTGLDHLLLSGATVRVTSTPAGDDANSILQRDGIEALATLIDSAEPAELSHAGRIEKLSRLDRLEYELARKAEAGDIGMRVSELDREVKRRRKARGTERPADEDGAVASPGRAIEIPEIAPWHEAVGDGEAMLDALVKGLHKYIVIDEHEAGATALWITFSHAFVHDCFDVAPKLWVKSAEKRSGKTRKLEVLSRLVARPLETSGISAASLRNIIDREAPTALIDEIDTMMRGDAELAEALRGILNSGFNRTFARTIKSVPLPGGGWEERQFSTFCPQVLAGIGSLPDTVADRSIPVEMKRKRKGDKIARLRQKDGDDLRIIARQVARWAEDRRIELAAADPTTPTQLNDRAADAWAPLLAIADLAGERWAKLARAAAVALSGDGEAPETPSTGLLNDIRLIFEEQRAKTQKPANGPDLDDDDDATKTYGPLADRIGSQQLLGHLLAMEDRPWTEANKGRPLTKHGLARRLNPFHITPTTVQLGTGRGAPTAKGYFRRQFEDAFSRYLPPLPPHPPFSTVRPSAAQDYCGFQPDYEPSDTPTSDGLKNPENPSVSATSVGLTVENRGEGGPAREKEPIRPLNGNAHHDHVNSNNGVARPNRRLTGLQRDIIAYAKTHPDATVDHIRTQFGGLSGADIAILLGR